jgi:hypothetical protein
LACLARWNLGPLLNEFVFRYNRRFYRITLEVFAFVSGSIQNHFAGGRSQSPRRQAKKALTALDRLNACANADLRGRIGLSFGAGCGGGDGRH